MTGTVNKSIFIPGGNFVQGWNSSHLHLKAPYNIWNNLSLNVCEYIKRKKEKDKRWEGLMREWERISLIRNYKSSNEREGKKICLSHKTVGVIKRSLRRCEVFWFEVLSFKILTSGSQSQIVWTKKLQSNDI